MKNCEWTIRLHLHGDSKPMCSWNTCIFQSCLGFDLCSCICVHSIVGRKEMSKRRSQQTDRVKETNVCDMALVLSLYSEFRHVKCKMCKQTLIWATAAWNLKKMQLTIRNSLESNIWYKQNESHSLNYSIFIYFLYFSVSIALNTVSKWNICRWFLKWLY